MPQHLQKPAQTILPQRRPFIPAPQLPFLIDGRQFNRAPRWNTMDTINMIIAAILVLSAIFIGFMK